jgi:hypothetical protein
MLVTCCILHVARGVLKLEKPHRVTSILCFPRQAHAHRAVAEAVALYAVTAEVACTSPPSPFPAAAEVAKFTRRSRYCGTQ